MANAKAAPAEEPAAPAAAGGIKRKGMLLAVIGLTVVLIAGGVGGYFAFRHKPSKHKAAPPPAEETTSDSDSSSPPSDSESTAEEGGDSADAKKKKLPAQYMDMQPSFVVNLEDAEAMRYLQVDVQLMTRDPKAIEEIKTNMPRIRNTLMLLFSQQHSKDLNTREAKENLQKQALDQVRAVMREETGSPEIEALYFTGFVMQ